MLKIILCIAVILLNIADAIYILINSKDRSYSVDMLLSGILIGVFVVMLIALL